MKYFAQSYLSFNDSWLCTVPGNTIDPAEPSEEYCQEVRCVRGLWWGFVLWVGCVVEVCDGRRCRLPGEMHRLAAERTSCLAARHAR